MKKRYLIIPILFINYSNVLFVKHGADRSVLERILTEDGVCPTNRAASVAIIMQK